MAFPEAAENLYRIFSQNPESDLHDGLLSIAAFLNDRARVIIWLPEIDPTNLIKFRHLLNTVGLHFHTCGNDHVLSEVQQRIAPQISGQIRITTLYLETSNHQLALVHGQLIPPNSKTVEHNQYWHVLVKLDQPVAPKYI